MRLRKWVKVALYFLLLIVLTITVRDLFTKKTIVNDIGKHYVCYGSLIQICSGESYE